MYRPGNCVTIPRRFHSIMISALRQPRKYSKNMKQIQKVLKIYTETLVFARNVNHSFVHVNLLLGFDFIHYEQNST